MTPTLARFWGMGRVTLRAFWMLGGGGGSAAAALDEYDEGCWSQRISGVAATMPCTFWTPCVRTGRSRHIFEGAGHMMLRAFRIPGTKDVRHHTFPKGLLRGPPAPTIDIAAVARPINGAVRGSGAKPGDANPEGTSVAAERVTAREFGRDHRLPPPPPGTCCTTSMMMSATRAVTGPIASGGAGRGPGKKRQRRPPCCRRVARVWTHVLSALRRPSHRGRMRPVGRLSLPAARDPLRHAQVDAVWAWSRADTLRPCTRWRTSRRAVVARKVAHMRARAGSERRNSRARLRQWRNVGLVRDRESRGARRFSAGLRPRRLLRGAADRGPGPVACRARRRADGAASGGACSAFGVRGAPIDRAPKQQKKKA